MDIREYYYNVFPQLAKGFDRAHYVLGYGQELIAYGWDPNALLVTVEPVDHLWDLTVEKGLEVFIPVIGNDSNSVMMPFDFEIYLSDFRRLYACPESQYWFFRHNIAPVTDYLCWELASRNIPHVLDYTPSGGHFLLQVVRGGAAWGTVAAIGYLDDSVLPGYAYHDPFDLKRNPPIKIDAAYVFSGLGFLSEFLAFRTLQEVSGQTDLPITIWDTRNHCVNLDLSWTADPGYMRIIRAPFSAHKKRSQLVRLGPHPLVDVMGRYYDGHTDIQEDNLGYVVDCMWEHDMAISHAYQFPGHIPFAEEGLVSLVEDYCHSPLKAFHDECHFGEGDLAPGEALHRGLSDGRLSDETRNVLNYPHPRMLQPFVMRGVVADLHVNGWHPRHIKNLIADRYREGRHGWGINFLKYNADLKAWAFARQYCAEARIHLDGWRV